MNSYFNLYHLKFFCDVVTYGSVSEAAKMNYVTQSAISQAISKLESHFNAKLLQPGRQHVLPTPQGKLVYEQAKTVFQSVHETHHLVRQSQDDLAGTVRFVTTKSLGMSFFAPNYPKLREKFPKVDLRLKMGGLNLIRTFLKREEAEFAIVVYDQNFFGFEKIPIAEGRFGLFQAADAPENLIEKGVFIDEWDGPYVKEIQDYFHRSEDSDYSIQDMTAGWELNARFAELKIGVGFFPDYILSHDRYPSIIPHPFKIPHYPYEICAIHNKSTKLSDAAKAIIENLTVEIGR